MKKKYSDFKGVTKWKSSGKWIAQHEHPTKGRWKKFCVTERDAAIAYDVRMIELGLEPVNILKQK